MTRKRTLALVSTGFAALALTPLVFEARAWQQNAQPKVGYTDTPMQPYGKWHIHDGNRPQPKIITPGTCSTQESPGKAPSDAIVLFDGKDLNEWTSNGKDPVWKVEDGAMLMTKGVLSTRKSFGDMQLHLEFSTPTPPKGRDQGRGNSGVILMGRYEIQVLDSYDNITYPDGQAGAIYGQYPPYVNASRKPGEWQTYDIIFTAPKFKEDKSLDTPAYVTVLHNGVLLHNHTAIIGPMRYRAATKYEAHEPKAPLVLQDHGNPVRYRNIWVRETMQYDTE
jgi:hypothetical protein